MTNETARHLMLAFLLLATTACEGKRGHEAPQTGEGAHNVLAPPLTPAASAPKAAEGAAVPQQAERWKTVQSISYDWAGDGMAYQFTLSIPEGWTDAGDFTRLQIARGGKIVYELTDPSGLVAYGDEISDEMKASAKMSPLPSPYLLMVPGARRGAPPILLVFGWAYGSSPGSVRVLALAKDGVPREALYLENFMVTAYTDLNHDSRMELIGKACFSENFGPDLLTYAPYSVFRFGDQPDAPLKPDLALSEAYNKKNYYGWAGPECREDVAVVMHPPGHGEPVILPTAQAEALRSKAR